MSYRNAEEFLEAMKAALPGVQGTVMSRASIIGDSFGSGFMPLRRVRKEKQPAEATSGETEVNNYD
jgi:hypothetical protein